MGIGFVRAGIRRPVGMCHTHVGIRIGALVIHVRIVGSHHSLAVERTRPRRRRNCRPSVVVRSQHGVIGASHLFVLRLERSGLDVMFPHGRFFVGGWPCYHSSGPAVIAHTIHEGRVHHGVVHVGVVNGRGVYVRICRVVVKNSATPFAAVEPRSGIAISVINSAVEANMRSPITGVPNIHAATPSPVAGVQRKPGRGAITQVPGTQK